MPRFLASASSDQYVRGAMASSPPPPSVPFGPELPFTPAELAACVKVAECIRDHRDLMLAPWLHPVRRVIFSLVDTFETAKVERICRKREREIESVRRGILERARNRDRNAVQECTLRSERIAKLRKLKDDQDIPASMPLISDGPVRDDNGPTLQLPRDSASRELFYPRKCYVCQLHYTELHHFYDQLCPPCAALNYAKRHQSANLHGKVALVTGARVKIGFFTALKLLRAGATVIATTRFPRDALARYQREPQYSEFQDRLHIFGVDLRDLVHVHCFLDYIASAFSRLDMIIHNAAQTIRRPPQFYHHLLEKELAVDHPEAPQLAHCATFESSTRQMTDSCHALCQDRESPTLTSSMTPYPRVTQHLSSAQKSQIPVLASDRNVDVASFPPGIVDVNGQQVDLRATNSWMLRLGEVETPEVAEVFTINAMAPFVINNRLLPMLERAVTALEPKFIINVSAMEGKFNRSKRPNHPHTNMAKAALNMMTRTCAADLHRRRIYMNSVDTGWINDEAPLSVAHHESVKTDFQTPLDEIDAAARVLDPIFSALAHPETVPEWGSFLKDYKATEW